ncbi:MAG: cbb3-type cytochrome c oxidase subunit II [Candidatus Velthaea sp.]
MKNVWILVGGPAAIYLTLAFGMAIVPGISLSAVKPTPGTMPLTAIEAHGRDIYVAEGCSYCHTQFVRPLAQDKVWGRPSAPGDFAYATPELFGTERNGPDLTNVGMRQPSNVWNEIHLYEPRALTVGSIMPSYRYMFAEKTKADPGDTLVAVPPDWAPPGKVVVATQDVKDLVAYIESLKQPTLGAKR